jgi:D-amino-acid dehydrogenase
MPADSSPVHDVAIIGGGIVAHQIALQLLRRGQRVALIDDGPPGGRQAASFGNAGWLSSHSVMPPAYPGVWKQIPRWLLDPLGPLTVRMPQALRATPWLLNYLRAASTPEKVRRTAAALRTLLKDAPALHAAVAQEVGAQDLIDARSGLLHAFPDRAFYERSRFGWDVRRSLGIEVQELDAPALHALEPYLSRDYRFGLFVPEAGRCRHPAAYVQRIAAHLDAHGLQRVTAQARGFDLQNGRLAAVRTTRGAIACRQAVVAAGIGSKGLADALGDRLPLESERGYHAMVLGEGLRGPQVPAMLEDRKVIVHQMQHGVRCAGQVEIAGTRAAPRWQRADVVRSHLLAAFPTLCADRPDAATDRWLGHRPSTYDGLPAIGPSPRCPQVVYACGHGHVGLVGSARTGRVVAQLLTGEPTDIDLAPFSLKRF